MTKNEKRKIRYNTVYNATGNVKLAQQARDWSDSRIVSNYGVTVGNKIPPIKKLSDKQIKERQRYLSTYQYAVSLGFESEEARILKYGSKRSIRLEQQYKSPRKLSWSVAKSLPEKNRRINLWREWSSDKNYPPSVIQMTRRLNIQNNFNHKASYGFAVAFYAFIEQSSIEEVSSFMTVDRFANGEIYQYAQLKK